MSYRCDRCNKVRAGSELKRISEVREVIYNRNFERFDRRERKNVAKFDTSFKGSEIVTEQRLCEGCYEEFEGVSPRVSNKPKHVSFVGTRRRESSNSNDKSDNYNEKPDFKGLKEKFEGRR